MLCQLWHGILPPDIQRGLHFLTGSLIATWPLVQACQREFDDVLEFVKKVLA